MGCNNCVKNEKELYNQHNKEEEKIDKEVPLDGAPTIDFLQRIDGRMQIEYYTERSSHYHIKLACDPGKPKKESAQKQEKLSCLKDAYKGDEKIEASISPQVVQPEKEPKVEKENPPSVADRITIEEAPPAILIRACKPQSTVQVDPNKRNEEVSDEPPEKSRSLLVGTEIYAVKKQAILADLKASLAPIKPLVSLAFDHSCLVLEQKGSVYDSYQVFLDAVYSLIVLGRSGKRSLWRSA